VGGNQFVDVGQATDGGSDRIVHWRNTSNFDDAVLEVQMGGNSGVVGAVINNCYTYRMVAQNNVPQQPMVNSKQETCDEGCEDYLRSNFYGPGSEMVQ